MSEELPSKESQDAYAKMKMEIYTGVERVINEALAKNGLQQDAKDKRYTDRTVYDLVLEVMATWPPGYVPPPAAPKDTEEGR